MILDPGKLTEQGVKDGIMSFRQMTNFLNVRLREAEGRLAGAELDVTEFRKLLALVRELSDEYRTRLAMMHAAGPERRPDG